MLRIALLIVALAAGGAAAWMAFSFRGGSTVATVVEPATPVPVQDVLVAAADLGLGQSLTKENMRWQSWPESALNPAYITRLARPDALETQPKGLAGSIVRNRMTSGEPIRDENLAPLNAGFLSAMLPSGKRAVAVVISAQSTAGGFILPNDRVDVVLTVTPQEKTEPFSSRTILSNVPVLAIDQTVDDEKVKAKVGKTATLELDPSQVEILAAGEATGRLSLALRSAADNGEGAPLSSQTIKFVKVGRIEVVEITASTRLVELAAAKKPLGPAWVPGAVMPGEPQ
jgi:pilus assembly protein CpaB